MTDAGSRPAVRLIASDLDGTLLRSDGSISARTRAAISAATAAGIRVVAATGRGWRSATPLLAPAPEISTAVLSNGSLVRHLHRGEDLHVFPIEGTALDKVGAVLDEVVPEAGRFWETAVDYGFDEIYAALRAELRPELEVDGKAPSRLPGDSTVIKLLVRHPRLGPEALLDLVGPRLPAEVTAAFSGGPNLIEITGDGVHKAGALAVLCDGFGISASEVVAVGDNHNDTEMLRWAGVGVAMANAGPEAAAASDLRTAHHMEDGVAEVIEAVLDGTLGA